MGFAGAGDAGNPHAGADGDGDGDGEGGRGAVAQLPGDGDGEGGRGAVAQLRVYVLVWEVMLHHGEPDGVMK